MARAPCGENIGCPILGKWAKCPWSSRCTHYKEHIERQQRKAGNIT